MYKMFEITKTYANRIETEQSWEGWVRVSKKTYLHERSLTSTLKKYFKKEYPNSIFKIRLDIDQRNFYDIKVKFTDAAEEATFIMYFKTLEGKLF